MSTVLLTKLLISSRKVETENENRKILISSAYLRYVNIHENNPVSCLNLKVH